MVVLNSNPFPPLPGVHGGTGSISGAAHVCDPATVGNAVNTEMEFKFSAFAIRVLSLEISGSKPPNWFGVCYPVGLQVFDTINIFCHPHPGNAGMAESDYASRGGQWPKLFRYAEIFGRQMSIARSKHITVIPFFPDSVYSSTGIMADQWLDIMEQVILHVRNSVNANIPLPSGKQRVAVSEITPLATSSATSKKGAPVPVRTTSGTLKNIVVSDFSRGRVLATSLIGNAKGIKSFVREVWDFDGVGGTLPSAPRVITYDQARIATNIKDKFHVPPARWVKYHNSTVANVHGDIPAMLACHAATISSCR